jgi:hypothetical protein
LTWFIGSKKAEEVLLSKRLISEEMLHQIPEQVSSAVQNPDIKFDNLKKLFDEVA